MWILETKTAVVTGGTDGIGKEIALELARRGIHMIIVGQNSTKGSAAAAELQMRSENRHVKFVAADVSLMEHTERLSKFIPERWPHLHYLVHSAGIVRGKWELTAEGVESNFAVNYLGRFRLTLELLPLLRAAAAQQNQPAKIVIVGGAAQTGEVRFEDVNLTKTFNTIRAVMQFQCANDIFTIELARRLDSSPSYSGRINVNILKYGVVKTNIRAAMPRWLRVLSSLADPFGGQTARQASEPAIRLLLDTEFEQVSGAMVLCIKHFHRIAPRALVRDPLQGTRLWELSEKLSRIRSTKETSILPERQARALSGISQASPRAVAIR